MSYAKWPWIAVSSSARRAIGKFVGGAVLVMLVACRSGPPVVLPPPTVENISLGEQHYVRACSECHGRSGEGNKDGPGLRSEVRFHGDGFLVRVMLEGHGDMAPANVTRPEAELVMVWLRSHFSK